PELPQYVTASVTARRGLRHLPIDDRREYALFRGSWMSSWSRLVTEQRHDRPAVVNLLSATPADGMYPDPSGSELHGKQRHGLPPYPAGRGGIPAHRPAGPESGYHQLS